MWKYGRKIIDHIFKRQPKCISICAEFELKSEADRDRSDIRVFETGLSSQQYGDYEYGTRTSAQEEEGNRLIAIAKEKGLFISQTAWKEFGDRKRVPSGESIVYFDENSLRVIKVRNPFAKSVIKQMHAQDVVYEHLVHNILFPTTKYHFEGISESANGVCVVLSQSYMADKYILPPQKLIDRYLINGLGLKPENRYYYGNDYIAITDVSADGDNVLYDGEKLYFIDPIIKMKCPATEVLDYYYGLLK